MQIVPKTIVTGLVVCVLGSAALPGMSFAKAPTVSTPRLPSCHATLDRAAFLPSDPAPGCAAPIATDKVVHDHRAARA